MSPNRSLAAISLPPYAEHDGENPIAEMGWLDLKPCTYAKQWGESGDENAVMAQVILNDVCKLVGYIPAKKMQKVPDSITH